MGAIQALAPSFGAVAPYNGSASSISGDWVGDFTNGISIYSEYFGRIFYNVHK